MSLNSRDSVLLGGTCLSTSAVMPSEIICKALTWRKRERLELLTLHCRFGVICLLTASSQVRFVFVLEVDWCL